MRFRVISEQNTRMVIECDRTSWQQRLKPIFSRNCKDKKVNGYERINIKGG